MEQRFQFVQTASCCELTDSAKRYGVASDGRLFRSENGGVLYPSAYNRTWHERVAMDSVPGLAASPMALRPYDLHHARVSLRLNAGVPATQVAECTGHSVEVLLTIYAGIAWSSTPPAQSVPPASVPPAVCPQQCAPSRIRTCAYGSGGRRSHLRRLGR